MDIFQAVVLGAIQGLTEFLPVSSSGHLVMFQKFFGLTEAELIFNVSVHMGTLGAVFIVFFREIKDMVSALASLFGSTLKGNFSKYDIYENHDLKMALLIITGSFPTAVIGLLFNEIADTIFSSLVIVGIMLIITGSFLWLTRYIGTRFPQKEPDDMESFTIGKSLIIGTVQGLAVMPGISRSGSTIVAGLLLGLNRETSARYSFLLSIPAILGAELLSLKTVFSEGIAIDAYIIAGTVTSFFVGLAALKFLLMVVRKGKLLYFAPYCWAAGAAILISTLF